MRSIDASTYNDLQEATTTHGNPCVSPVYLRAVVRPMKTKTIRAVLTRDLVEQHPLPAQDGVILACESLRGFNVLLTSKGSRSYYVHARRKGASRTAPPVKFTFGEVGKLNFGAAHKTARNLLASWRRVVTFASRPARARRLMLRRRRFSQHVICVRAPSPTTPQRTSA